MYLKDDLRYKKVKEQLTCKNIQIEIRKFEEKLKQEVCSNLPTAFWHSKKQEVAPSYVKLSPCISYVHHKHICFKIFPVFNKRRHSNNHFMKLYW